MKRLVLALALSGLALTGQAQAASSCPPGFAMLQASDTCVRISGRVRGETLVGSSRLRASDSFQTQAGGRIRLDVRKQTEYGPVRAVISVGNLGR
ncbi:porin [Microvirga sp. 2MCAF35]|uniref:porin n=1 Tax=Microvirga sp. 2MCAF35 TaxID=3232987 RepID=UPI003F9E8CEF